MTKAPSYYLPPSSSSNSSFAPSALHEEWNFADYILAPSDSKWNEILKPTAVHFDHHVTAYLRVHPSVPRMDARLALNAETYCNMCRSRATGHKHSLFIEFSPSGVWIGIPQNGAWNLPLGSSAGALLSTSNSPLHLRALIPSHEWMSGGFFFMRSGIKVPPHDSPLGSVCQRSACLWWWIKIWENRFESTFRMVRMVRFSSCDRSRPAEDTNYLVIIFRLVAWFQGCS